MLSGIFATENTVCTNYSIEAIVAVENLCNTLPRKILGYKTPKQLF